MLCFVCSVITRREEYPGKQTTDDGRKTTDDRQRTTDCPHPLKGSKRRRKTTDGRQQTAPIP